MTTASQTKRWRILRRCLLGAAVLLTLIATFYTEESWRGKRAWENCKRELEAKGIKMDWTNYIPAPVPDDQNVFAVPEMQQWFVGRGATDLSKKIIALVNSNIPSVRLSVADLAIGLPGAVPPSGFTALSFGDPRATSEVSKLLNDAVGPTATDPIGFPHTARRPEEIQPAKVFLQCQTAPTAKELEQFLPKPFLSRWSWTFGSEKVQVELVDGGSYRVTILAPDTSAEYLALNSALEPEFSLIRQTLQRPYTRIAGDYQDPWDIPIPNFVTIRTVVQRLAALAQCHLLQGQPEEALRDLTLIHDLCRILESRPSGKPMTLVAAMIHVAVTGLYTSVIADGLAWHDWREPQLLALQEQLKEINLLPDVRRAFEEEPVAICHTLETITPARLAQWFEISGASSETKWRRDWKAVLFRALIPQGWIHQNMAADAHRAQAILDSLDPANQMVFPKKVDAVEKAGQAASSHPSPYTFLAIIAIPNYSRALLTTARNQTQVREALIACALERYRLAHNAYPETLDALAPQFLAQIPPDLIGGRPLHYRLADGGKFLLYSVGWNETDDGGKPGSDDDWVWDDTVR
jgi:hypothetical protein